MTIEGWRAHLTTLFPEVRPRRVGERLTFELRCLDAIPPAWHRAALTCVAGLVYDSQTACAARAVAGAANPDLLIRAARLGLADAEIGSAAAALYRLALQGAARLGDVVGSDALDVARAFGERFVLRGTTLADAEESLATRGVSHRGRVLEQALTPD
jgi:glutamate--cysteine ligase